MPPGRLAAVLALVGMVVDARRPDAQKTAIDEVIHPWAVSIVDTPTPPTGSRRIDLEHWDDLLRAAEVLGRPILRLHGGEGGSDGRLFYVADGPQSYVFGFDGSPVNVTRSGAYAPRAPHPIPATPVDTPPPAPTRPTAPAPAPAAPSEEAAPEPPAPPPEAEDPADALLGPEVPDEVPGADLPSATVVERKIRGMIHELLADFRKLPPTSDRLELGTEHVQRAIDMLHLGRYGVAQIELNKAARILNEAPSP